MIDVEVYLKMDEFKEIGQRIRKRRRELKISQVELCEMLGYKDHSTVSKIEKGERGLPQKKILKIAVALQTTPAYLMGWDLLEKEENEKIKRLLKYYQCLDTSGRNTLELQAKILYEMQKARKNAPKD